jgi:hypothetical protein
MRLAETRLREIINLSEEGNLRADLCTEILALRKCEAVLRRIRLDPWSDARAALDEVDALGDVG